jgi:hypothetical protein
MYQWGSFYQSTGLFGVVNAVSMLHQRFVKIYHGSAQLEIIATSVLGHFEQKVYGLEYIDLPPRRSKR